MMAAESITDGWRQANANAIDVRANAINVNVT